MHSRKIRVFSLSMVLVLLLTLMPVQAVEETDTGTDEGKKTEYTVALNGNGGVLNGEEKMVVTYSAEKPLNLREYPFAWEGYVLAGWSTDESGGGWIDCNVTFNSDMGFETLYAVWLKLPESGNYAIFNTAGAGTIADAVSNANDLYCVELTENFKMPTLQRSDTATAEEISFWSSNSNSSMIYYEGEEFMPNNGMQFNFRRFSGSSDCHQLIFDGNGGTGTTRVEDGTTYVVNKYGLFNYRDGDTVAGQTFRRPGYILTGFNTEKDGTGTAYPTRNIKITANMDPVQILYAQWSPEYHLEDNVSLVIGGEDKSDLLDSTTECSGTGWTYQSADGVSVLHLTKDYNGGSIICKRENVNIIFDSVFTKRIEVSDALTLTLNSGYVRIHESDTPAIRAKSVIVTEAEGSYKIISDKAAAVQTDSLSLHSENINISGYPAVSDGTGIACGENVNFRTNYDSKGIMVDLYTVPKRVVLYGNGGNYNGNESIAVDYPDKGSLDLGQYTFKKDGFILTGWAVDKEGTKLATDAAGHLKGTYKALYAVWASAPQYEQYVLFKTNGYGTIEGATPLADNLYCVELTADFKMPTLQKNSIVADADLWLWLSSANSSLIYYEDEAYTPDSGMEFYISPVVEKNGYHQTIFDGNGGTGTTRAGDGTTYVVNKYGPFNYRDGDTVAGQTFRRPGYILTGFNTEKDGTGTAYPTRNIKITADMDPVQILYAQWSPLQQLKNGARFIVDGSDMSALVDLDDFSDGVGWGVLFQGGETTENPRNGQLTVSDRGGYQGGSIAYEGNLMLLFSSDATVGQVEAAGNLNLSRSGSETALALRVRTSGVPALRATDIIMTRSNAYYDIEAKNAVGVDAAYLMLASPNVTIKGDPAVREGAVIECMKGIGYTRSADKKTLTTYAINQTITLDGNGGTLNGKEQETVTFSSDKPLELSKYTFQKDGCVLVAWASDPNTLKYEADANETLERCGYNTLYAVWLKVPADSDYIIIQGDKYDGAYSSTSINKNTYNSFALPEDGKITLPELEMGGTKDEVAVWVDQNTFEAYLSGETVKLKPGTVLAGQWRSGDRTALILDGNGGTMNVTVNDVPYIVTRRLVNTSVGSTFRSQSQFVMDGYTMTGYNTKADGTGKSYPYDEITVTEDMKKPTILYAQWKESDPDEETITIDGLSYTARADHGGYNWSYAYNADNRRGYLFLKNYQGGSIASDIDLSVTSSGQSVVNGSISSKKSLWTEGGSTTSSLTVIASEGSALIAEEGLRLQHSDKLSATSENAPAVKVTGELYVNIGRNSFFEAAGAPCALSYGKMIKDRYQTYLIRGGTDKASAVPITDDTYKDKAYISYEMRERVLTLHGNGGKTAAGADTFTATSKDNTFDLGEYTNTFTNGGKRLLGWSKTENSATIDYVAASGTMYYFDWLYEFAADLYAVWEGEEQCGVVLKNYGYFDGDRYTYSEQYTAVAEGGIYTLPESSRAGYIFKGWLGSDGNSYAAGDTIKIPTALSFTAQYEVGRLTVGGVTYTANRVHGSDALGWMYYPDGYNGYYSGEAQMNLYKNYSSGPITLDGNLTLAVGTDLTGTDNLPAISVTGDMNIRIWGGGTLTPPKPTLTGGENAPAIKVGGTLHLGAPVTLIGGGDAPAMDVGVLDAECAFLAGESKETATRVGTYNVEHYVRMDLSDPVTFQLGDVAPDLPDTETYRFIGWSVTVDENNSRTTIWYRPGEKITGSEKTLTARYVSNDEGMIFLDGNGAVTAYGVRYSDAIVHLLSQAGWRYMNADELKAVFHRDGFELTGYKGPDGTVYELTELDKLFELFDDGQLHMGKTTIYTAQWMRIGNKTEDSSAYYTKADDGTVKIESVDQGALEEQLKTGSTAQIDVSKLEAEKVTLPVSAVNDVLDLEAETLSIKTADAAITLDKTAMQSVVKTADGNDIQLHVSTGDALNEGQTAIIGDIEQGMVLDVSLTANGTEIHSFNGKVTVSVPFDWTKQGVLQAWYLADDGKKEPVEVAYRDGNAVLTLKHFSTYAIVVVTAADAKSPVIDKDSVTLSRTTAAAGDTVEVTVKVTDNVAVSRVYIVFWNNDTGDQLHLWMSRVGDSDIFSAQFEVTENTPAGMWRIFEISAHDTTENNTSIYFSHNENNFFVQSEVPPITVSVDNISIDKTAATLGDTVTISIKFDNDRVNSVSLSLSNRDSGRQNHFLDMTYDEETKSYVYRFVVDNTVPSGYWEIGFINVNDAYGYGGAEYIGSSKAGFTVTGTSADAKAPVIDNSTLAVSKSEIEGGESSVISVKITDNVGVDRVVFSIANEETGKILAYPYMHYNEASGKYEYTFTADETIPSGHWRVWTIHAEDTREIWISNTTCGNAIFS